MTLPAVRLADLPPDHAGRRLLTGYTPAFAAQSDPRFSYTLFVPEDIRDDERPKLWVFVHGTRRRTKFYLDGLADLARAERAVVMTPLFPAGISAPDDIDGYKFLDHAGIRFDQVLLDMADEVAHRWNADPAAVTWMASEGGADRLSRARTLAAALRDFGSDVRFDVVEGVGHVGEAVLPAVTEFLLANQ